MAGRERQDAERERDVRRHRDAPASGGRGAEVHERVEERRDDHAAERRADRQHHRGLRAQLAKEELALDLEPDDEEEHGHEAVVDPMREAHLEPEAARADAERRVQEMLVCRPKRRIREQERDDGAREQEHAAPGLPREERLERRHERAEFSFHMVCLLSGVRCLRLYFRIRLRFSQPARQETLVSKIR